MTENPPGDHRRSIDRRKRPTRPWDAFRTRGRRRHVRRDGDRTPTTAVDRFPLHLALLGVLLLALTIADGLFTVVLVYCRASLFGTRFRVGTLLPLVVVLYMVLIAYQIALVRQRLQHPRGGLSWSGSPGGESLVTVVVPDPRGTS